jgi:hypothetical protein
MIFFLREVHPAETQQRRRSNMAVISQIRHAALSHEAFSSGTVQLWLSLQGELLHIFSSSQLIGLLFSPRLIPLKQAAAEAARQLERQLGRSS